MRTPTAILLSLGLAFLCADAAVDLHTTGMQELKQAYERETRRVDAERADRLGQLIRGSLAKAEDMQRRKKAAGNVAGMAAARSAVKIVKRCSDELAAGGDFEIPAKVRHEIKSMMDALRRDKKVVDDEREAAIKALRAKVQPLLADQLRKQGVDSTDPATVGRHFDALLSAAPAPAPPDAEEARAPDATPEAGPAGKRDVAPKAPTELAASGHGSNWVSFANWHVETTGLEIIPIPVVGQRETRETEGGGMISGQPYKARYEPLRVLPGGDLYVFRVNRLPGQAAADVVEWPGKHNDWALTVRVRPGKDLPCKHGLELQVSGPGADRLPVAGGETEAPASAASAADVRVSFETRPEGALVYVERKVVRQNGEPVRTPCAVSLKAGLHQVVLRKRGHLDAIFDELEATEGLRVTWDFKKNPAYEEGKIRVSARSAWQPSGVEVKQSDHLLIKATGEWRCGRKRELVDAVGYPNDKNFFHYYFDPKSSPRQLAGANYGALLMRIGDKGRPVCVGTGRRIKAETSGMLYFDVNESVDGRYRRDNGGTLTVEIQRLAATP